MRIKFDTAFSYGSLTSQTRPHKHVYALSLTRVKNKGYGMVWCGRYFRFTDNLYPFIQYIPFIQNVLYCAVLQGQS